MAFGDWLASLLPRPPDVDTVYLARSTTPVSVQPMVGDIVRVELLSTGSWWWSGSIDVEITAMPPSGSVIGIVRATTYADAFPVGAQLGFSPDEIASFVTA